jgi:hypothetical protein
MRINLTVASYRESIVNSEQADILTCNGFYRPSHPSADGQWMLYG